jgi:hypothetical protein
MQSPIRQSDDNQNIQHKNINYHMTHADDVSKLHMTQITHDTLDTRHKSHMTHLTHVTHDTLETSYT